MRDAGVREEIIRRPRYHVTAPRNWLNDPNGPIRHDGRYHLFYQHNPVAPVWGAPWWGHVSSADLVRWVDHEPALVPRPGGPDSGGCWSGCARVVDDAPLVFYTGVVEERGRRTEAVCLARGSRDMLAWTQAPIALIAEPPQGTTGGYHRDPFVFGEPGAWRMLIGSGFTGDDHDSGAILHYASTDLATWTYRGILYQRPGALGPLHTGPLWECPQLFRDSVVDVLVFSVNMEDGSPDALRHCVYALGRLDSDAFEASSLGRLDWGNVFYAPAITEDGGRVLMWGWVQEKHDRVDVDHSGALSLPRVVWLRDGRLCVAPAAELVGLRERVAWTGSLADGDVVALGEVARRSGCVEIEATVAAASRVEVALRCGSQSAYRVVIDAAEGRATVESGSSGPFDVPLERWGEPRRLRLFVDGSLLELYIGDEAVVTTRCYEAPADRLIVSGPGSGELLRDVTVYDMADAMIGRDPG